MAACSANEAAVGCRLVQQWQTEVCGTSTAGQSKLSWCRIQYENAYCVLLQQVPSAVELASGPIASRRPILDIAKNHHSIEIKNK